MVGPTKTDNGNSGYLIVVDVAVVAPTAAADVRLTFENLMLNEDKESGNTHMAMYITINRLTQRMVALPHFRCFRDVSTMRAIASRIAGPAYAASGSSPGHRLVS